MAMGMSNDFGRVRRALLRQGEPDRVPIMELDVDRDVKKAFLGRPLRALEDEVEFWMAAGYDYVPLTVGMRTAVRPEISAVRTGGGSGQFGAAMKSVRARYSVIEDGERERRWAEEGTGIIRGRAEFDAISWPEPDAMDYSAIHRLRPLLPPGAGIIVSIGCVFATVSRLMGFQNMCEKMVEDPDLVARIFDRVGRIQVRVLENVLETGLVDATWHPDDVAYTGGPMVSPRFLRRHHWPWYREMCEISNQRGIPIIYHSDGQLDALMEDIVGCGFTALHPIEPKAMDIVRVKREYGHRIALIGNIDLGYTLTRGTPEEVESEVRERIRALAPGGGYALSSANSITEYVPLANFNALRMAAFRYGAYPIEQ